MKIRNGFVSNSSSSSFIIKKDKIKPKKLEKLLNHATFEKYGDASDEWSINLDKDKDYIIGKTSMDNFDMESFCFDNNIPVKFFSSEWDAEDFLSDLDRSR